MKRCLPLLLATASALLGQAHGEVKLPSIFSDHLVLMKAKNVPVWGKADPGETVRVTLGETSSETKADATGHWQAELNLQDSPAGPFEMTVEGKNRLVIHDAVVGEVWLASGQSNMEMPLKQTEDAPAEIAQSANPFLRQFLVKKAGAKQPADDCQGQWTIAGPETSGDFTAVGYYFGKDLQHELKTPVGILHSSHGGTLIEPWTPTDAFDRVASFKASDDALRRQAEEYPVKRAKFLTDFGVWLKQNRREDEPLPDVSAFAGAEVSTAGWQQVQLPGKPSDLPSSGVYWIRRDVDVPAPVAKQGFKVMIGPLAGYWQAYWNGEKIDERTYANLPGRHFVCYFPVPLEDLHPGKNSLAIRIYSPAAPLAVLSNALWAGPIDLNGPWSAKVERTFPDLPPEVMKAAPVMDYEQPEMQPGGLYNGMIHPLVPYALAGVLWYQGESNVKRAYEYRLAFTTLIEGWREKWHRSDLPFYFCQLANSTPKVSKPGESGWAELRESQDQALALPQTGEAIGIDLGEAGDLHFRDKKTLGHRLFLIAQARHYGHPGADAGPAYDSMGIESSRVRLHFQHTDSGLVAKQLPATYPVKTLTGETAPLVRNSPQSELEGFAICGGNHRWVWADARIEGDTVVVWSGAVPQPVAVRYGWSDNPTVNLTNGPGLPAGPFRTDDFPVSTQNNHF